MTTKSNKDLQGKGAYRDEQTDLSQARTTGATSQDELKVPRTEREDLPEADRADFHDGVYSGPGTGVAPGRTDTGGADDRDPATHPKMGTTGGSSGEPVAGGSLDRSSAGSDADQELTDRSTRSSQ